MEHQLHIYPLKTHPNMVLHLSLLDFREPKLTNNTPFIKYFFVIIASAVLLKMIELEE
jgi:hypothetical protein